MVHKLGQQVSFIWNSADHDLVANVQSSKTVFAKLFPDYFTLPFLTDLYVLQLLQMTFISVFFAYNCINKELMKLEFWLNL